ncbi:hypothetical protein L6452_04583 [Arctium lappa]|uniref:Uncharacterized protein n=1 Tax=Arctium lappa TaxID=4217 RepID=A0ACB9EDX1_ARCLA|nr:hypothetical protein L6452_04583 [Arctium lappa]
MRRRSRCLPVDLKMVARGVVLIQRNGKGTEGRSGADGSGRSGGGGGEGDSDNDSDCGDDSSAGGDDDDGDNHGGGMGWNVIE